MKNLKKTISEAKLLPINWLEKEELEREKEEKIKLMETQLIQQKEHEEKISKRFMDKIIELEAQSA